MPHHKLRPFSELRLALTILFVPALGCYHDKTIGHVAGPADAAWPDGSADGGGGAPGAAASDGGPLRDGGGPGGGSDGGIDTLTVSVACNVPRPGANPLRRLTYDEYGSTTRDLLGVTNVANWSPSDRGDDWPDTPVFLRDVVDYSESADKLSAESASNLSRFVPCAPDTADASTCADQFVATFGKRAFRAPLPDAELTFWRAVFQRARAAVGFQQAARLTMQAFLQAPRFLYRIETTPGTSTGTSGVVKPDAWEMASRLSYFFTGSPPDSSLLAAADAGRLTTREEIAGQAKRLVADPRVTSPLRRFHSYWLDLYDGEVGEAGQLVNFGGEALQMMEEVVLKDDGRLSTLLTAPYTFLNGRLAQFYGRTDVQGTTFQKVALDPKRRAGILTTAAVIRAVTAEPLPGWRGAALARRVLCAEIEESTGHPVAFVDLFVPRMTTGPTLRELVEQATAPAECQSCHSRFDGIGYAFGHYHQDGRWLDLDYRGYPIDTKSSTTEAGIGSFTDAIELVGKLAANQQVASCYARRWFRYAAARPESDADACSVARLTAGFESSGRRIPDLLTGLAETDAFLYRPALVGSGAILDPPGSLVIPASGTALERQRAERLWVIDVLLRAYRHVQGRFAGGESFKIEAHVQALLELQKELTPR